jgi:acetolactate synthase regulatory subunit
MKFTLEIRMHNTEGALERLLGKLRQRSFSLCALVAGINDPKFIDARITVEGLRAAEPVIRQIGKLYDVEQVSVFAEADASNGYRHKQNKNAVEAAYMPV